jgi:hypothetical protein
MMAMERSWTKSYDPWLTDIDPGHWVKSYVDAVAHPRFKELDRSLLEICVSAAALFPEESQQELEKIVGWGKPLEVFGMTDFPSPPRARSTRRSCGKRPHSKAPGNLKKYQSECDRLAYKIDPKGIKYARCL